MTETLKTAGFLAGALALVVAAAVVEPERRTPSLMSDEGETFYPGFNDPQSVKAIEVVDYDEPTAPKFEPPTQAPTASAAPTESQV